MYFGNEKRQLRRGLAYNIYIAIEQVWVVAYEISKCTIRLTFAQDLEGSISTYISRAYMCI